MKEEFTGYLKSIGITETFRKRIETIYEFYGNICPDEIGGIFVTDYIKEDGSREYQNLWFFSPKYCMEAKLFITTDDFDITPIQKRVYYWTVEKKNYDFKKATEKSRLHLKITLDAGIKGDLKASKGNCDHLRNIILRYIAPNLKE